MIDEIETTGPVVRVWLLDTDEEQAGDEAREALGTDASPVEVVDHGDRFEVIFEAGDLR